MIRSILPTSTLVRVTVWSGLLAAYSSLAVLKEQSTYAAYADLPAVLEAALSLAIGLLLAFRINRAFDRWWEGRTLWGQLVNATRNLAVKTNNVTPRNAEGRDRVRDLMIAFPYALRSHLRGEEQQLPAAIGDPPPEVSHHCSWIVNQIYGHYEVWKRRRQIQYGEFRMLDREARVLLEVCGGCERIRNTPIAASFRVLLRQIIAFFLLTLPWGLATDFGWLTPLIVFVTAYCVIAAEEIADRVEHPFQVGADRLELDSVCATIERTVGEIMSTHTDAHEGAPEYRPTLRES